MGASARRGDGEQPPPNRRHDDVAPRRVDEVFLDTRALPSDPAAMRRLLDPLRAFKREFKRIDKTLPSDH